MAVETTYPNYQPLRSRWVPRVPEHWSLLRAKNFLREIDDRSKTGEETLLSMRMQRGLVPHNDVSVKRIAPENLIGYKKAQPDELVLNRMQAGNAMFFRNRQSGLVSPDYAVFRLLRDDNPEYLGHLFRSWPMRGLFRSESKGLGTGTSGFLRLYSDRFASLVIPLPPRPEQDDIVAYLRVQDAHIARFIKTKRDLIKLLTEQKLRIIDHAVTRGLDASVALKPSGIEWLGEVPEHWELQRLKFLASNVTNQTTTKANDESYLALEHVESWTGVARPLDGEVEFASTVKRFVTDDVLFGKLRPYLAKVTRAVRAGVCVSEFLVLRSRKQLVLPAYLEQLLRCKRVIDLINSSTAGAKMPRADWTFIGNARLPIPPVNEQQDILSFIALETKDLDETIQRANDEIALIREYRDRLIADVVTGQVDVRGWQPGPDDVVDDAALAALGDDQEDVTEEEDGDGED
ncbi:MAG: restriction endonuclease subunit S [Burkholderiaceae bacterium]|nr:restriction endonuclease subunit S [Burkholderiaceae bacterium]